MTFFQKTTAIMVCCVFLFCGELVSAETPVLPDDLDGAVAPDDSVVIPETMTIREAVNFAIRNRYEIQATDHRVEKARMELNAAAAGWFPTLDFVSQVSRIESLDDYEPVSVDLSAIGIDEIVYPETNIPDFQAKAGVRLTQLLYAGGRTSQGFAMAKEQYLAKQMSRKVKIRDIALSTILACRQVKLTDEFLSIARDAQRLLEDLSTRVKNRYDKGAVSRLAWSRSEAEVLSARLELERAFREQRSALDSLIIQIGIEGPVFSQLMIIDDEQNPVRLSETGVEELVAAALKERPDIMELEKQIASQACRISWEKSRYFPSLALTGEYAWIGYDDGDPGSAYGDFKSDFWSVSLTCEMNLFEGGRTYYKVKANRELLADLKTTANGLRRTVSGEIHQRVNKMSRQHDVVRTAGDRLALEKDSLDMVLDEFRLGAASIDKVADYHTRYLSARKEYATAVNTLQQINARFKWAAGMELP